MEEAEIIWVRGRNRESSEGFGRNPLPSIEAKKEKDMGKGKGKEKMVDRRIPGGTRAKDYDTTLQRSQVGSTQKKLRKFPATRAVPWSLPNRHSRRYVYVEPPNASRVMVRREPPPEKYHHKRVQELRQSREWKPLEGLFEDNNQHREDNESEIESTRLDEHSNARLPFFMKPFYSADPPGLYASQSPMFASPQFMEPFVGRGDYSPDFQDEFHSFGFGMQATPVHPQVQGKDLFASLGSDINGTFVNLQYNLGTLLQFSSTYYPWSEYGTAPGGQLPTALKEYQSFVAEVKRSVFPLPRIISSPIDANEYLTNDLDAEHSRLTQELSMLRELEDPFSRLLESTRMQYWDGLDEMRVLAVEEYERLRAYRRMLLERLGEVDYEIDQGLNMDHLSLEEEDEQYRPHQSSQTHCHWHHHFHSDQFQSPSKLEGQPYMEEEKRARKEARTKLEEYNKRWAEILSRPLNTSQSGSTALTRLINIPYPPLYDSLSDPTAPTAPSTTSDLQAWATHAFLCHAFNLTPYLEPPPPTSPLSPPQLAFSTSGSQESQIRDLTGLKIQLKMEKVRWHEDRLKAVFGAAAAREERAKGVWGVVIDLKRRVDEALELMQRE